VSFVLPINADLEPCLLDTSAALAFVQPSHAAHATTYAALVGRAKGLAGLAAFETYSVLTRLAPPDRLTPQLQGFGCPCFATVRRWCLRWFRV
jgi:hypothetical protein